MVYNLNITRWKYLRVAAGHNRINNINNTPSPTTSNTEKEDVETLDHACP
ncbi:hypothetical protein HanIR_Chr08g0359051 [Helianthus annuus]|nr:hypothetical protein HanIR_Chr08g0359051 [Helianthus annuus]